MLGTAGHVDHGKTALVKLFTGCDTDTLVEEKQRQMTIDLGFARCRLANDRIVGVVDVPGHLDFIRNMVAGAHGIDVVILVVAADDGVMPQTVEHLRIMSLLGKRHGLVALTKIDLVSEERRREVIDSVKNLLRGTFLEGAPICPISNVTGEGYQEFFRALNAVVDQCEDRPALGPFRMWVDDSFSIRGVGTVITGIPTHGSVRRGDKVCLLPGRLEGRVRGMQVYGEEVEQGFSGECVALNIPEFEADLLRRGMVLCAPEVGFEYEIVEAELTLLPEAEGILKHASEVQVHLGTAFTVARVYLLEADKLHPGETQVSQLRFAKPIPVVTGERFVIRAMLSGGINRYLTTVGGGCIIGTRNARIKRRSPEVLSQLQQRRAALGNPEAWCECILKEYRSGISVDVLLRETLLTKAELTHILSKFEEVGVARCAPTGKWVHRSRIRELGGSIASILDKYCARNPHRLGASVEEICVESGVEPALVELALNWLKEEGLVQETSRLFAPAGWKPKIADELLDLIELVDSEVESLGFNAPTLEEIANRLQRSSEKILRALMVLCDRGRVVRIPDKRYLHVTALEKAKNTAINLFRHSIVFTTMDFRDALGVSRKYAIPILDYLDQIGFTVRNGNKRTPGVAAKSRLQKG